MLVLECVDVMPEVLRLLLALLFLGLVVLIKSLVAFESAGASLVFAQVRLEICGAQEIISESFVQRTVDGAEVLILEIEWLVIVEVALVPLEVRHVGRAA